MVVVCEFVSYCVFVCIPSMHVFLSSIVSISLYLLSSGFVVVMDKETMLIAFEDHIRRLEKVPTFR